jgi:hypothetical protein
MKKPARQTGRKPRMKISVWNIMACNRQSRRK